MLDMTKDQFMALHGIERDKAAYFMVKTFYIPHRQCKTIQELIQAYTGIELHPIEIERHVNILKRTEMNEVK